MKIKSFVLTIAFSCTAAFSINGIAGAEDNYATEFKGAALETCDRVFHHLEDGCPDMICRDVLVNAWAQCWKKSMNVQLDKRLLALKKTDNNQFRTEMDLQKSFNTFVQNVCGKSCGSRGTMKGIPYNFCRVDAYKYRTAQAMQINSHAFTVPLESDYNAEKSRKKNTKEIKLYKTFSHQLCKLPDSVWKNGKLPADCQKKVYNELSGYEFTDNVCNLN